MNAEISSKYHLAAEVVRYLGTVVLENGKTLSETITVEDVSYWKVIESTLTVNHLVHVISKIEMGTSPLVFKCRNPKGLIKSWLFFNSTRRFRKAQWTEVSRGQELNALILGFTPYITKETVRPLFNYLRKNGRIKPILLTNDLRFRLPSRKSHSLEDKSLWNFWDKTCSRRAKEISRIIEKSLDLIQTSQILRRSVEIKYSRFATGILNTVFSVLSTELLKLIPYHVLAQNVLKVVSPSIIVSSDVNDPRIRMFCILGKKLDICSMDLQFSIYDECSVEWKFLESDLLAVTGIKNQRVMELMGVPNERMTVTGSARFDNIENELPITDTDSFPMLDPSSKFILFASQPNYFGAFADSQLRDQIIRSFVEVFSKFSGHILLVKPHPVEDERELRNLFKDLGNVHFIAKNVSIRPYIKAADGFVTFNSGSLFDALALTKPTLGLLFESEHSEHLIFGKNRNFFANDVTAIERFLASVCNGSNPDLLEIQERDGRGILDDWFRCSDGLAPLRIEEAMLKLIR